MEVDPRRAQLDLAGSLGEKEAAEFVAELWSLMRCGLAAIAGARAEEARDGQAVAREGGVAIKGGITSVAIGSKDMGDEGVVELLGCLSAENGGLLKHLDLGWKNL